MPTAQALKLCPNLLLVPGRMEVYKETSKHIRAIFARYTSLIEPLSLDEAYLDVTDSPTAKTQRRALLSVFVPISGMSYN